MHAVVQEASVAPLPSALMRKLSPQAHPLATFTNPASDDTQPAEESRSRSDTATASNGVHEARSRCIGKGTARTPSQMGCLQKGGAGEGSGGRGKRCEGVEGCPVVRGEREGEEDLD